MNKLVLAKLNTTFCQKMFAKYTTDIGPIFDGKKCHKRAVLNNANFSNFENNYYNLSSKHHSKFEYFCKLKNLKLLGLCISWFFDNYEVS